MKILENFIKTISDIKKTPNWKNVSFLHGVIMNFRGQIEDLEKENIQLKNKEGRWLSQNEQKEINKLLKKINEKII